MSGTMSREDLIVDLKAMLGGAAGKFSAAADADFIRHLDLAAADMARFAPVYNTGSVTLVADQDTYNPPADLRSMGRRLYGDADRSLQPWNRASQQLPMPMIIRQGTAPKLLLRPKPTAALIATLGSTFEFTYIIRFVIAEAAEDTTVPDTLRPVLLVRAVAQAMQELSTTNISKPVQLGSGAAGVGSMPKNGHPAALSEQFLKLAERMAEAA
jgi:hypothetical protein